MIFSATGLAVMGCLTRWSSSGRCRCRDTFVLGVEGREYIRHEFWFLYVSFRGTVDGSLLRGIFCSLLFVFRSQHSVAFPTEVGG